MDLRVELIAIVLCREVVDSALSNLMTDYRQQTQLRMKDFLSDLFRFVEYTVLLSSEIAAAYQRGKGIFSLICERRRDPLNWPGPSHSHTSSSSSCFWSLDSSDEAGAEISIRIWLSHEKFQAIKAQKLRRIAMSSTNDSFKQRELHRKDITILVLVMACRINEPSLATLAPTFVFQAVIITHIY